MSEADTTSITTAALDLRLKQLEKATRKRTLWAAIAGGLAVLIGGGGLLGWIQWNSVERTDHQRRPIELMISVQEARARSFDREIRWREEAGAVTSPNSEQVIVEAANKESDFRERLINTYYDVTINWEGGDTSGTPIGRVPPGTRQ